MAESGIAAGEDDQLRDGSACGIGLLEAQQIIDDPHGQRLVNEDAEDDAIDEKRGQAGGDQFGDLAHQKRK